MALQRSHWQCQCCSGRRTDRRLACLFKDLLHEVEQLVIKHVGIHQFKLVIGGSEVGVIVNDVGVTELVVFRALHFLFERKVWGREKWCVRGSEERNEKRQLRSAAVKLFLTSFSLVRHSMQDSWVLLFIRASNYKLAGISMLRVKSRGVFSTVLPMVQAFQ